MLVNVPKLPLKIKYPPSIHPLLSSPTQPGRCMYSICTIYSWALNLIPWIEIKCKLPPAPIDLEQFILTSNHISFGDLFIIHRCMVSSMTRRAIENVRLVYWQKLAEVGTKGERLYTYKMVFYIYNVALGGGRLFRPCTSYDERRRGKP